jgi:hypothetical protein
MDEQTPGQTPDINIALDLRNIRLPHTQQYNGSELIRGYVPSNLHDGAEVEDFLNQNQGTLQTFGNWVAQTTGSALLGTVESASYLADFEQHWNKLQGKEQEYDNAVADLMRQAKEGMKEIAPIYRSKEGQQAFSPGSVSFWTSQTPDVIGTVLGLLVPASGAAKAFSGAAKLAGLAEGAQAASALTGSVIASRYAESTMEAGQVFKDTMSELQSKYPGMAPEQQQELAGQAASRTWNTNWLLAVQDAFQYHTLFKGLGRGASRVSKGANGLFQAEKTAAFSLGDLASQVGSEGGEEGLQFIFSEEAKRAGLNQGKDYFGPGFWNGALADYVGSDEFKASVALGALGGGIFAGGGKLNELKNRQAQLNLDALAKERANYVNDIITSKKIDNNIFAELAFKHLENNDAEGLKATLKEYASDPDTSADAKTAIQEQIADVDFLANTREQIKSTVRPDLQKPAVANYYDLRQSSRLQKDIMSKTNEIYQELQQSNELPPELAQLKRLKVTLDALEKFKTNPKYTQTYNQVAQEYVTLLAQNPDGLSPEYYEAAKKPHLSTAKDVELNTLAKQALQNAVHISDIRDRIAKYNSPEGQVQAAKEQKEKEVLQKVQTAINTPSTTKAELQKLSSEATTPEAKQKLEAAIGTMEKKESQDNQDITAAQLEQMFSAGSPVETIEDIPLEDTSGPDMSVPVPQDELPGEFNPNNDLPPVVEYPSIDGPPLEGPTENAPTDFDPESTIIAPEFGATYNDIKASMGEDTADQFLERFNAEQAPEPKPQKSKITETDKQAEQRLKESGTIPAWAKMYQGTWNGDKFEFKIENGKRVPQLYWDNTTGQQVPATKVFATTADGHFLVDTPLVKEGDPILLEVVDNGKDKQFPYTFTKGFRPQNSKNYVINVYRVNSEGKKLDKLPIQQLASEDNEHAKGDALSALRYKVIHSPEQKFYTNIASKNIGDPRTIPGLRNSVEVLEFDYHLTDKNNWSFSKTPHNPIFVIGDYNGNLVAPNVGAMKGVSLPTKTLVEDATLMDKPNKNAPGAVYTVRMNPAGNFKVVLTYPRNLNTEELTWVRSNMANLLATQDYTTLSQVYHIPEHSVGVYSTKAGHKVPDVVNLDRNRFHIVSVTKANTELLIPITGKNGAKLWAVIAASGSNPQIDNFLTGKPFLFTYIDTKGKKQKGYFTSTDEKSRESAAKLKEAFESTFNNQKTSRRNILKEVLNSETPYTDPVTKQVYNGGFYDFLKTGVIETDLEGSKTKGYGDDSSYSFANTRVRINPNPASTKIQVDKDQNVIIKGIKPVESVEPQQQTTTQPSNKSIEELMEDYDNDEQLRPATTAAGFKTISEQELVWFQRQFGDSFISIAQGVDRILSKSGKEAFGIYQNALVRIADFSEEGTIYHEAFHFVLDPQLGFVTEREREAMLKGTTEEARAEEFRAYMLSDGKVKPKEPKAANFFARLWQAIQKLIGVQGPLEKLFSRIASKELTMEQKLLASKIQREGFGTEQLRPLPGFFNYKIQQEAVDATVAEVMKLAAQQADAYNVDILEILKQPSNIDLLINAVKDNFTKDALELEKGIAGKSDELRRKYAVYKGMGIIHNPNEATGRQGEWENKEGTLEPETGFKAEVIKGFKKFGFQISVKDASFQVEEVKEQATTDLTQEEFMEIEQADEAQRFYDQKQFVNGINETLSQRIRLFLSTIPEPGNKKTVLGTTKYIDFNSVMSSLKNKLVNTRNPITRLEQLAKLDPIAKTVFDELSKVRQAGNERVVKEFATRFNLAFHNLKTILIEYDEAAKDIVAKYIDTDRQSINKATKNRWREEAVRKKLLETDGKVIADKAAYLNKELQAFKTRFYEGVQSKNRLPYDEVKAKFQELLKEVGIILPAQLYTEIESQNPGKTYKQMERWFFGKRTNSLESFLDVAIEGKDPFVGTSGLSDNLANRSKNYIEDVKGDTFMNEFNDMVNPINLPSYLTDFFRDLKDPEQAERLKNLFQTDKFYENNEFVKLFTDTSTIERLTLDFISATRTGESTAKDFGARTAGDSLITRLAAFYNSVGGDTTEIFIGTFSDKGKQAAQGLPRKKEGLAKDFLTNVLRNTMNAEISRIQRIKNNAGFPWPANYAFKGSKFLYLPELNNVQGLAESVTNGQISADNAKKALEEANQLIEKHINDQYQVFKDYLVSKGIISKEAATGNYVNAKIPNYLLSNRSLDSLLKEWFFNDYAWRLEMSKVYNGDLALYKDSDDYYKRGYQTVTPGIITNSQETYTRGIYPKQIKKTEKPFHPAYKEVNKTDAQSYVNTETYRKLAQYWGIWSNAHEDLYQFAWKNGQTVSQAIKEKGVSREEGDKYKNLLKTTSLEVLKPFQFADRVLDLPDGSKMITKEQFKDSWMWLNPELTARHSELGKLSKFMTDNAFDVMSAADTVKVGSYGIIEDYEKYDPTKDSWKKRTSTFDSIRFPQMMPSAHKEEVTGTQFWKLILGNIDANNPIVAKFNELWEQKIIESAKALQKKIGFGSSYQLSNDTKKRGEQLFKLKLLLQNELGTRNVNDNYEEAIKLVVDEGTPNFQVDLGFPAYANKFISILTNLFKKNILQQKSPGFAMVNFADFGVNTSETSSNLNMVVNKDGSVEAEIGLPIAYFRDLGLNFTNEYVDKQTHKIKWDQLDENQKQALQFILYRIPTSNKSSMTPCRIAMVLPESSGNVVMLPGELTVQQGLDFDVDKSQILRRVLTKESKVDGDNVDNKLFDIAWSILTDPKNMEEVFTPLDFATIVDLKKEYIKKGIISDASAASPLSIVTDTEMEIRNKHGKAMIGIDSRANTAHAVLQTIPEYVSLNTPIFRVKGFEANKLGGKIDNKKVLISKNFGEMQQSSLDNAKDPIKAQLNLFPVNDPVALFLIAGGVDLGTVFDFMNQPVLRKWMEHYEREGGNSIDKATKALLITETQLSQAYSNLKDSKERTIKLTTDGLTSHLGTEISANPEHQARILEEFLRLQKVAAVMTKVNNVLSVDTFSDMTSIEAIDVFLNQMDEVTQPDSPIKLDPAIFSLATAPSSARRLAAFYDNALVDAKVFNSQFVAHSSVAYESAQNYLANAQGLLHLTDKETLKSFNTFLDYYTFENSSKLSEALNNISPDYTSRWSYVQESRSIWKHLDGMISKHSAVKNNPFIKGIFQYPSQKNHVQMIGVINTSSNIDKSQLTKGWYDLLNHSNPEIKTLGGDLIRFAIQTSGFTYNTRSFADLIPVDFWVSSGLSKEHKQIVSSLGNDLTPIDSEAVTRSFIRHKFEGLNEVPEAFYNAYGATIVTQLVDVESDGTHVKSFFFSESDPVISTNRRTEPPRFVKIFDNTAQRYRLYEQSPQEELFYKEIQPLGEPRAFWEITGNLDGRGKSVLPANEGFGSPDPYSDLRTNTTIFPMFGNSKRGENPYISKYIPGGKVTAAEALGYLLQSEGNIDNKNTIEVLLRNSDKITTMIEASTKVAKKTLGQLKIETEKETGDLVGSVIEINSTANTSESTLRETILHELIHAYTVGILEHPITEAENNFALNVNRLLADARKVGVTGNGVKNKHEFIAELASSEEFRNELRSKEGLWNRWIRNVRKLFGFKDKYDQVLEQLYGVLDAGTDYIAPVGGDNILRREAGFTIGVLPTLVGEAVKEKLQGKKRLTALEQMHASIKSRIKRLRSQGKKVDADQLDEKYQKIQEHEAHEQIVAFMIMAHNEMEEIKDTYKTLAKDAGRINPDIIQPIQEQLASYKLLRSFNNQIHRNPDEFIPEGADPEMFKKYMADLITDVDRMTESINRLGLLAFAHFVKESSTDPNLTMDKIIEDLEFADRDVTWYSRLQDVGKEIRDNAVAALHRTIAKIKGSSWRKISEDLHQKDATDETTTVEVLVSNKTNEGYHYERRVLKYKKTGYFKALSEYENWVGRKTTFSDKFAPIIDQQSLAENDSGVQFISPWSKRGKEILAIKEGSPEYPLRQFYETFVLGYLKSQENIPVKSMRPGLRVPSIQESMMETLVKKGNIKEKLSSLTDHALNEIRRRYDETDYYSIDENGDRQNYVPTRFVAKQDGQNGRMNTRQVSLDIATTIPVFVSEMYSRQGMDKVVSVLEIGKTVLANRQVMANTKLQQLPGIAGLLTAEREGNVLEGGGFESMSGESSEAYKAYEAGLRQHVYGQLKKEEGAFNIGKNKFSLSKMADAFLKYSGFNLMFGNIAIPITNKIVGEFTTWKEAVGGNFIGPKDLVYGKKLFYKTAFESLADFAQREKKTKMGRIFSHFNPYDHEAIRNLGTNSNYGKEIFSKILKTGGSALEYQIGVQAMGAVMNRFKAVNAEGKEVPLYEALEVDGGKVKLEKGFTYKGKKEVSDDDVQQIKDYTLRVYQNIYGVNNVLDKPASNEYIIGRLVNFMRGWLQPGINTRWRTKKYDEAFGQYQEGHYISAIIAFNNIFTQGGFVDSMLDSIRILSWYGVNKPTLLLHPNELNLPEQQQKELISLRKANIRKTLFELYSLVALSLLFALGWDDDEDSYAKYMVARVRRELGAFISPTSLWDVLKTPSVAMSSIDGMSRIIYDTQNSIGGMVLGEDQPVYERGPGKGQNKLWFDIKRQSGLNSLTQFEDLSSKIRVISTGYR